MKRGEWGGVADGTRTHDDQNHNLGLYQLSYSHRRERDYTALRGSPRWGPQFTRTSLPFTARDPMRA